MSLLYLFSLFFFLFPFCFLSLLPSLFLFPFLSFFLINLALFSSFFLPYIRHSLYFVASFFPCFFLFSSFHHFPLSFLAYIPILLFLCIFMYVFIYLSLFTFISFLPSFSISANITAATNSLKLLVSEQNDQHTLLMVADAYLCAGKLKHFKQQHKPLCLLYSDHIKSISR